MATKPRPAGLRKGCFLTDGIQLYRVVDALEESVLLEDCHEPEEPYVFWSVAEVLQKLKVVKHEQLG